MECSYRIEPGILVSHVFTSGALVTASHLPVKASDAGILLGFFGRRRGLGSDECLQGRIRLQGSHLLHYEEDMRL